MINAKTDLYCVLGNPVTHSKSPIIHNTAFQDKGLNAAYLAFEPSDIKNAIEAIKTLGIKGASITIPFKESIMAHLDWIDPMALSIGAVNTIVNENGFLKGYNTDCQAAITPLKPYGIAGKTVCIVGAGGAAKAVAYGIAHEKGNIIITNRTAKKGIDLATHVNGKFVSEQHIGQIRADVVINTTSLGMEPNIKQLSFPAEGLAEGMVVMDVVYTPIDTALIRTATQKKCAVIDGLSMFIAQAAAQFKLWTGIQPDTELMRKQITGS